MDREGSIIIVYHYNYRTFNFIKLLLKLKLFVLDYLQEMIKFQYYLIQINK